MEEFNILQEIREILHGLGEKRPRIDSVSVIQSVLVKQMVLLFYHTKQEAKKHNNDKLLIKHVLYILQNHKLTLIRVLSYFLMKENIHKFTTTVDHAEEIEEDFEEKSVHKKQKLCLNDYKPIDKDFVEAILNLDFNEKISLDPINVLTTINLRSNDFKTKRYKKMSVYKQLMKAMVELKLDINITKEDIRNSTVMRHIRVNELSLALSANRYESFQICRRKNFQNKKVGELLLKHVHKYLPTDIEYSKEVKEIFLFLAKETIACLFDHVCQNRKNKINKNMDGIEFDDQDNSTNTKKKFDSILVEEISAITSSFWKESSSDICNPYVEDNKFFCNQLIFD